MYFSFRWNSSIVFFGNRKVKVFHKQNEGQISFFFIMHRIRNRTKHDAKNPRVFYLFFYFEEHQIVRNSRQFQIIRYFAVFCITITKKIKTSIFNTGIHSKYGKLYIGRVWAIPTNVYYFFFFIIILHLKFLYCNKKSNPIQCNCYKPYIYKKNIYILYVKHQQCF